VGETRRVAIAISIAWRSGYVDVKGAGWVWQECDAKGREWAADIDDID
jgi:hypothetical protein